MRIKTDQFASMAERELKNEQSRTFLNLLCALRGDVRDNGLSSYTDPAGGQNYGRAIRAEAVARMPELLEEFEKNVTANGANVIWARDAAEANEIVLNIAKERNIKYVTKGKSMVTEETGLNETLIKNGVEAFETDLGELIIQLLGRPPFHIVGPAINVPVEEVRDIFMEKGVMEKPSVDPTELAFAARLFLRDKFHHLEMGITGINMAVAETGTIINVENEGNIRFNKSTPKTQVSIMSLEKVVPSMEDAVYLLRLLCRSCTGQKMGAYVSMDSGPKRDDELDGPEELFIVIVDNGRSDKYADFTARGALRCIRCGACLASCPVYSKIGGYSYGWAYSGPIGQVLNPLLLGLDRTSEQYRASTSCGKCKDVCPGGVDHPGIFRYYREKDVERSLSFKTKGRPWQESRFFEMWSWSVKNSKNWNRAIKMARPLINRSINKGTLRKVFGPLDKWMHQRDLPAIPRQTFHERWKNLKNKSS